MIRATIYTITITIIIITIAVNHKKESIIFVAKKIITLTSIQIINNGKQKNFCNKIKNFAEINANTTYFWLIIKEIQVIILIMTIKK